MPLLAEDEYRPWLGRPNRSSLRAFGWKATKVFWVNNILRWGMKKQTAVFFQNIISDVTCNRCGWSAKGMASARGTSKGLGGMQPRNVMESDRLKNGWFWPVSAGRLSSSLSLSVAPKYQRFQISFHSYKSKGYKVPKINILPT